MTPRILLSALASLSLFAGGLLLGLRVEPFNRGYIAGGEFLLWPSILVALWAGLTWLKKRSDNRKAVVESFK